MHSMNISVLSARMQGDTLWDQVKEKNCLMCESQIDFSGTVSQLGRMWENSLIIGMLCVRKTHLEPV